MFGSHIFSQSSIDSGSKAIDKEELIFFLVSKFVLSSHKNLNEVEILYASNFISSLYNCESIFTGQPVNNRSINNASINNTSINDKINNDNISLILTLILRKNLCKYAITFNQELDVLIIKRDNHQLRKLLTGDETMFIELYDNNNLNLEIKNYFIRILVIERYTMHLLLTTLNDNINLFNDLGLMNPNDIISDYYDKCYTQAYIADAKLLNLNFIDSIFHQYEVTPDVIYLKDNGEIYCYKTLELLELIFNGGNNAIGGNNIINPRTNQPFHTNKLQQISEKLNKEQLLYQKFLQLN